MYCKDVYVYAQLKQSRDMWQIFAPSLLIIHYSMGGKMVSVCVSVIRPLMVHTTPGLIALTIHTLLPCYQLVQPFPPTGSSEATPCVIMSV